MAHAPLLWAQGQQGSSESPDTPASVASDEATSYVTPAAADSTATTGITEDAPSRQALSARDGGVSEATISVIAERFQKNAHQTMGSFLGIEGGADVSFTQESRDDSLSLSYLYGLQADLQLLVRRGRYFTSLQPYFKGHGDMSLEPRDPFVWGMRQAYVGATLRGDRLLGVGLQTRDFMGSSLASYTRALPTTSLEGSWKAWDGLIAVSTLPYAKKNRPIISSDTPYTIAFVARRKLDPRYFFMLRDFSVRWLIAESIPSELAEAYGVRGNDVRRGRLAHALRHDMSTLGAKIDLGCDVTPRDELTGAVEALVNLAGPIERSVGLWAELGYAREVQWDDYNLKLHWSYHKYSVGSDAFLAEFGVPSLGYTGVDGQGIEVGVTEGPLSLLARYRQFKPRERNIHKRKTRAVRLSLKYAIQ